MRCASSKLQARARMREVGLNAAQARKSVAGREVAALQNLVLRLVVRLRIRVGEVGLLELRLHRRLFFVDLDAGLRAVERRGRVGLVEHGRHHQNHHRDRGLPVFDDDRESIEQMLVAVVPRDGACGTCRRLAG